MCIRVSNDSLSAVEAVTVSYKQLPNASAAPKEDGRVLTKTLMNALTLDVSGSAILQVRTKRILIGDVTMDVVGSVSISVLTASFESTDLTLEARSMRRIIRNLVSGVEVFRFVRNKPGGVKIRI
ncbi:hypothetical protein PInf_004489 [Phytophthora infestans]|nr:hypothetical protein PInf_004489 [Phytophthora infestans]